MHSRRTFLLANLALTTAGCDLLPGMQRSRFGQTGSDSRLEAAAEEEGALVIDMTTDQLEFEDLLGGFERQHPGVAVQFRRPSSSDLHANLLRAAASGEPTADILISSAMDLQFKLVNDGFAQVYESTEKPYLPEWAVW